MASLASRVALADGNAIPIVGYGVYEASGKEAYAGVIHALDAGYRHVDSAQWYGNEAECGKAISDWCSRHGVPRGDVFYTSKLMNNNGYANAKRAIDKSVAACGLGYIDLFLIHSPYPDKKMRLESWRAVEEAKDAGQLKSIGVSNYAERHLQELYESKPKYLPVVNQVDLHPFMVRAELVKFCKAKNIVLEAWGPLVRGMRFQNKTLLKIAQAHGKSAAQVLLRWGLQHGFVVLPKSVHRERIVANADIFDFELSPGELAELDALDEYLVTDWDPIGDKRV